MVREATIERLSAEVGRTDSTSLEQYALENFCRDCKGMENTYILGTMAENRQNLKVYDRNCFERNTAWGE